MSYRMEPTEIPGEFVRVDKGPTDIRGTLTDINDRIGEAYSALSAINRFLYGEDPRMEATRSADEPSCFAAALSDTRVRAMEMMELAVGIAKRLGA